jgi:LysM repeat protein
MSEDIQALQRTVGQLSLHIDSLEQEKEDLKKKILSQEELKNLMENTIAASRAEIMKDVDRRISQSNIDTRKDILADVTKQLEALATDTNAQFEKLRRYMGSASVSVPHSMSATSLNSSPPPKFDKGIDYVVKHGDTLAKICIANHVSSRDLILANPQLNGNANMIREGQHLFLPQRDGASAPRESAPTTSPSPTSSTNSPTASTSTLPATGAVLNFPSQ